MSIGGRIKRVHQLDVLERLDKKNPKLAQEPVLNRRIHAVDSSSSANWTQDRTTVTNGDVTLAVGSRITGYVAKGIEFILRILRTGKCENAAFKRPMAIGGVCTYSVVAVHTP